MRVVLALVSLVAVALAGAGAARAKGGGEAVYCGATRCVTMTGDAAFAALDPWWLRPFSPRREPARAPYYSVHVTARGGLDWRFVFVPSRRAVLIRQARWGAYDDASVAAYWRSIPAAAVSKLRGLVQGLEPHPASASWSA